METVRLIKGNHVFLLYSGHTATLLGQQHEWSTMWTNLQFNHGFQTVYSEINAQVVCFFCQHPLDFAELFQPGYNAEAGNTPAAPPCQRHILPCLGVKMGACSHSTIYK